MPAWDGRGTPSALACVSGPAPWTCPGLPPWRRTWQDDTQPHAALQSQLGYDAIYKDIPNRWSVVENEVNFLVVPWLGTGAAGRGAGEPVQGQAAQGQGQAAQGQGQAAQGQGQAAAARWPTAAAAAAERPYTYTGARSYWVGRQLPTAGPQPNLADAQVPYFEMVRPAAAAVRAGRGAQGTPVGGCPGRVLRHACWQPSAVAPAPHLSHAPISHTYPVHPFHAPTPRTHPLRPCATMRPSAAPLHVAPLAACLPPLYIAFRHQQRQPLPFLRHDKSQVINSDIAFVKIPLTITTASSSRYCWLLLLLPLPQPSGGADGRLVLEAVAATCVLRDFPCPLNAVEGSPDGAWLAVGCDLPLIFLVPAGAEWVRGTGGGEVVVWGGGARAGEAWQGVCCCRSNWGQQQRHTGGGRVLTRHHVLPRARTWTVPVCPLTILTTAVAAPTATPPPLA